MITLLAQLDPPPTPSGIALLIPPVLMGIILGTILASIARRKGRNRLAWFFVGFIPLFGLLAGLILASRPDIALVRRVQFLEEKIASLSLKP